MEHDSSNDREVKKEVNIMIGTPAVQIVFPLEVKPTFRTPCQYLMIGAIKIEV
jgi:hypothetical protein